MVPPNIIFLVKSLVEIDKSTIEAVDGSIFSIDTEYVLGNSTDIESNLLVDEKNNNSKIEDDDLKDCNLEND